MKERGIIFNSEMIRAILDGRKTQTRRALTSKDYLKITKASGCGEFHPESLGDKDTQEFYRQHSPFGQIGDRLWVRETWQGPLINYTDNEPLFKGHHIFEKSDNCVYKADGVATPEFIDSDDNLKQGWRPSIHMPRWASRITLEITDVRVERLQDISKQDAISEGAPQGHHSIDVISKRFGFPDFSRSWFAQIWMDIYGEDNWVANPWVWVIEFKRV